MRARLLSVAGLFRVDLPRPVLLLNVGGLVNSFGFGVILPFEIVYLHGIRHFGLTTSGLILSTVMGTGAIVAAPAGALLDRIPPKTVLVAGSLLCAGGYGTLAFAARPWQAFACSFAAGVGVGASQSAAAPLTMAFLSAEQRPSAFALQRVALNLGIGSGALVSGLIVGTNDHLRGFQVIYLLDAASFCAFVVVLLLAIPAVDPGARQDAGAHGGFRQIARHRAFVLLLLANTALVVVGYSLFANLMGPYAKAHTTISIRALGLLFLVNTVFIVVAQLPARGVAARLRRHHALALMAAIWAVACLLVLPSARIGSPAGVALLLAGVSVLFGIGECFHAVVLGPAVVELAPAALLARYLALFSLTFTVGIALGPSVGAAILAASPNALWVSGAVVAAVVAGGFLVAGRGLEPSLIEAEVTPLSVVRAS